MLAVIDRMFIGVVRDEETMTRKSSKVSLSCVAATMVSFFQLNIMKLQWCEIGMALVLEASQSKF